MPPKRRRRFQGLYYHSSPPKVLPMNGQVANSNGRRRRDPDDLSVKLSTIRIWMHEKDIGKLTRVLWAGQGNRLRQQASTNPKVKRFLTAVPYVMNSIKDVHQAVIDNSLETLQANLEPPVPPALVTCRDANGLNLIHKAAGLGHATILEYLITTWPDGVHETDITGKTPLHWAASAKNNMRCYTLLTQAGCDEEAVDYKMKTPSFYRHKPHEIERAFLTYVPEAPRVSPDVATDWEALSDDSGDGKKLDIKIPEMNGFGRHSNAESNTSEAEMTEPASGQEDEEMSKEDEEENAEAAEENEQENHEEPAEEDEEKTNDAQEETEEQPPEEKEEDKEEESAENKDENEDQEEEAEKEPEGEKESKDEKQQTQTVNETTANVTKDSEADDDKLESKTEKELEESGESNGHKTDNDHEDIKMSNEKDAQESLEKDENETDALAENVVEKDRDESNKEKDEKKNESDSEDHSNEALNEKTTEQEIGDLDQKITEHELNEESKKTFDEKKSEQEKSEVSVDEKTIEQEKNENIFDENKSEQEKSEASSVEKKKEQEENKDSSDEKTNEQEQSEISSDENTKTLNEEQKSEEKEITKDEEKDGLETDPDIKANEINDKEKEEKEKESDDNEDDSKTIGEALTDIKDEVKDNVKYLANQIKSVFSGKDEEKEKDKENKSEKDDLKINGQSSDNKDIKENEKKEDGSLKVEEENIEERKEDNDKTLNENKDKTDKTENENENEEKLESTNKEETKTEDKETKDSNEETKESNVQEKTSSTSNVEKTEDKPMFNDTTENDQQHTQSTTDAPTNDNENSNSSNENNKPKTPPTTTAPKTPPKESPKKENDKTDEDENNNTNKLSNELATTTNGIEEPTKPSTADGIIDEQFKELNKSLEEYKKAEETFLEEKEKDIGEKLEEMTDNLKENVKDMADKVMSVFTTTSPTKDESEKLQNESNDVIVHTESPQKETSNKKVVKDGESSDEDEDTRIQSIIASGDMEQLAQIVLNGDGQKLLNVEAAEPEIQAFLKNVPNYMNKIRRVHEASRNGSLLNLQQALDRRKFAIAKDEISPNGATPLHVAVLFGNSDIVRYLSARFPETTTVADNDGRTALHYAAVINDNGHFYNVLLQLGANPKVVDKMGHTPEDYLSKEELKDTLSYKELLKRFGAEELEEKLLSDQGQIENQSCQENPIFKTEQGKYLAENLADPLIKALTQVAHKRPNDPLEYLTNYLQSYVSSRNTNGRTITQAAIHSGSSQTNSTVLASSKPSTPPVAPPAAQMQRQTARMNGHVKYANEDSIEEDSLQQLEQFDGDDGNDSDAEISKKLEERDEHGQSMLHFACARSHRKGGLIHLIEEAKADITYRDELYRTARDVALQANQLGNAKEIDRYVMSLAIVGDIKPFEHLAISGYDHIIDVVDDNETPIIDVVEARGLSELGEYLRTIRPLEELREELHQMIRDNNVKRVKEIADGPDGKWLIKAKNYYGRTALHIAILKESVEIVEYFVNLCPEALKIGDNLERTALHYAMGTNIIESISRILIQNGAKRTYKDLKGRQPSYYFMNKADILRLQEEEDENR